MEDASIFRPTPRVHMGTQARTHARRSRAHAHVHYVDFGEGQKVSPRALRCGDRSLSGDPDRG